MAGLSAQQRKFCEEYVKSKNKRQSAIDAGYAPNSAHVTASRLLNNANVEAYISELLERSALRTIVTLETLTAELNEARAIALQQDDAGELRQNTMAKAKLHGLDVNKIDANVGTTVVIKGDATKL